MLKSKVDKNENFLPRPKEKNHYLINDMFAKNYDIWQISHCNLGVGENVKIAKNGNDNDDMGLF